MAARKTAAHAPAPESAPGSDIAQAAPEPELESAAPVKAGTLVALVSLIYSGRIYEAGEPLPDTFPADTAEALIASGEAART